jgi:hypothetical protein
MAFFQASEFAKKRLSQRKGCRNQLPYIDLQTIYTWNWMHIPFNTASVSQALFF